MHLSRLLDLALQSHQAGDLEPAEKTYRQILEKDPHHSDARHLLGVIAYQRGDHAGAIEIIQAVISQYGQVPMYHNSLGLALQRHGQPERASQCFRSALSLDPDFIEAYCNLGDLHRIQGEYSQAIAAYEQALQRRGEFAEALCGLGRVYGAIDNVVAARRCFEHALELNPHMAEAYNCLGLLEDTQGSIDKALEFLQRAVEIEPAFAEAFNNIGNVLMKAGRTVDATACYRRALQLAPLQLDVRINLGRALKEQGQLDSALGELRQALTQMPDSTRALQAVAVILQDQGRTDEALSFFEQALVRQPSDALRIKTATLLPVIPGSADAMLAWRQRYENSIDQLARHNLTLRDPVSEVNSANFYLSYHGLPNRELQIKLARVYENACPSLLWEAPHCRNWRAPAGRIRVGFISRFMHNHSIGRTTRGLMENLSRERFEVHALFIAPFVEDGISRSIRQHADKHLVLPTSLPIARQAISDLKLDILFYQDIGMEPFTYFLAFSRLAPVQCVSFGHPDTTGIRNMDYFISNDLFEPPHAAAHYSEKLALLQNLGSLAYYYRPTIHTARKKRDAFGLSESRPLYLCPQTLFKFHPDFDRMLAGILRNDPDGQIAVIEAKIPQWTEQLKARLQDVMPDVIDRVLFLPQQQGVDFLNLLAIADVVLDTPHFNGMNTSLEAFAVGTPIVTLPTALQRGRHTTGMYRKMCITDCIAMDEDDYVRIAVRIGTDRILRNKIRDEILHRNSVLYEDIQVAREFERFFVQAVEQRASSTP